ncbi:killer cell lectin-like receptor subfamily B member 1B allele C [Varanus komodoensis]|uniref:killer cell lectin-like receptor subfamily B member 1B allele C n=1 Tax=Varanus komodoensis TaxID=61221 RepID=UPI001CF7862F|nr:killer cell lectin-like receptor subfamily B member 1B allele C [Varanus komodoensis]
MIRESRPAQAACQMEGTSCYFNFRPRKEPSRFQPESQLQGIFLRHPRCHRCLLGFGCTTILVLFAAVIVLSIWVLQRKEATDALGKTSSFQGPSNEMQPNSCPDNCQTLRKFLCNSHHQNHSADNLKCKLCPKNWMLYENKCYWTSDEKQTWNKSQNICAAKNSQLAVFHNKEELDFIRRITDGAHLLWIGLTTISGAQEWSWIDGSPLNTTLLEVTGPAQANSCGMLKLNKVILEACTAVTKWICEKDALLL